MSRPTVDVVIPTFHPDRSFRDLLVMLNRQTVRPDHILIINTEESGWDNQVLEGIGGAEVFHITREQFDHAGTRNTGSEFSGADYLIFMTQDAVPCDENLVRELLKPFRDPLVKASYARQFPKPDARIAEGLTRLYNYPATGCVRSMEDVAQLGVKAYFCSNVCAAYDHKLMKELHGFQAPAIFNEDMVYAASLINLGCRVAYAAEAKVAHSHNYSNMQQFRRNFDNGVSWAQHPEVFSGLPSTGEGMKMVRFVCRKMREMGKWELIPAFLVQCMFRFAGFRLGRAYRRLPRRMVKRMSMNRSFWQHKNAD